MVMFECKHQLQTFRITCHNFNYKLDIYRSIQVFVSLIDGRQDADHMTFVEHLTVLIEFIVKGNTHCGS